jgi:hypothetical protein
LSDENVQDGKNLPRIQLSIFKNKDLTLLSLLKAVESQRKMANCTFSPCRGFKHVIRIRSNIHNSLEKESLFQ